MDSQKIQVDGEKYKLSLSAGGRGRKSVVKMKSIFSCIKEDVFTEDQG